MSHTDAIAHLTRTADKLAEIKRGKVFAQWNAHAQHRVDAESWARSNKAGPSSP